MRTEGWRFGWGILGCNRGINGVGESDSELTVGADVGSGADAAATLQCFSRPRGTGSRAKVTNSGIQQGMVVSTNSRFDCQVLVG